MSINTVCPQCQSQFVLQDELAGRQVQCQNCQAVFVAPEPNTQAVSGVSHSAAPSTPQQDTFLSVFEQVASPQAGPTPNMPAPAAAPPHQGHVKKTHGNNRGLLIGGIVGVSVILLCLIGVGVSYAWSILSHDPDSTELASTIDDAETPELSEAAERMIRQYGEELVVRIDVNVSNKISQSPQGFLLRMVKEPLHGGVSTNIHRTRGNNYEVYVAPVTDLQAYFAQLHWLNNKSLDQASRTISGDATMPTATAVAAATPDPAVERQRRLDDERRRAEREKEQAEREAEAERQRLERIAEQKKRDEEREKQAAIRKADREHKPRPGENTVEWLRRCIDESPIIHLEFDSLAKMQVQEEFREEISEILVNHVENEDMSSPFTLRAMIKCLAKWRTDASDQILINMMNSEMSRHDKGEYLMPALAKLGTEKAANAIGPGLADTIFGDKTARALINMGAVAEQAALDWRKHKDQAVRYRVYSVLAEVGTRASIDPLKENRTLEKDFDMKKVVREVLKAIEARHPDES